MLSFVHLPMVFTIWTSGRIIPLLFCMRVGCFWIFDWGRDKHHQNAHEWNDFLRSLPILLSSLSLTLAYHMVGQLYRQIGFFGSEGSISVWMNLTRKISIRHCDSLMTCPLGQDTLSSHTNKLKYPIPHCFTAGLGLWNSLLGGNDHEPHQRNRQKHDHNSVARQDPFLDWDY